MDTNLLYAFLLVSFLYFKNKEGNNTVLLGLIIGFVILCQFNQEGFAINTPAICGGGGRRAHCSDNFAAEPTTCTETASSGISVAEDAEACAAVLGGDLNTPTACDAVLTHDTEDGGTKACTYNKYREGRPVHPSAIAGSVEACDHWCSYTPPTGIKIGYSNSLEALHGPPTLQAPLLHPDDAPIPSRYEHVTWTYDSKVDHPDKIPPRGLSIDRRARRARAATEGTEAEEASTIVIELTGKSTNNDGRDDIQNNEVYCPSHMPIFYLRFGGDQVLPFCDR